MNFKINPHVSPSIKKEYLLLNNFITIFISLIICCIGLSITGCSKKNTTAPKTNISTNLNGTLIYHLSSEPGSLNPILSSDVASSKIEDVIFNGLFKVNDKLELVPDLLESYTVTNNNKSYVFTLKPNIKWHDGHPLTAEDVKFTFDKILDPKTNTVRRSGFIINGEEIKTTVISDTVFKITLSEPFAPFLAKISMHIIPKHILENDDINTASFNHAPIGTGPFKFKRWKTSQFIEVTRNESFFGNKAKVKSILYKIIPDSNTALVSLEKKELDVAGVPAKDLNKTNKIPHIKTYTYENLGYSYLGFNLKKWPFSDLKFRQAMSHAINRKALVKGVLKGLGSPVHIPSTPVSWAYPDTPISFDYNPEKSKLLLKEMGLVWDPKLKIFKHNNKAISFNLMTSKGSKTSKKSAQIIQQYLKNVGINMTISQMEWKSFLNKLESEEEPKPFEAAMLGWSLGIDPDGYSTWHSTQYPKGFNFVGYSNKKVDSLLEKGRTELNKEKRKEIYSECFNIIGIDCPYLFLFSSKSIAGVNTRVHGLSKPGPSGLFNIIENVWVTD